jgi:predicted dehydrogenase/transglutaminase-like putative cysteine protease
VGIIGLDAHAVPFTQIITDPKTEPPITDMKVVAAVPAFSSDIPFSADNIEKNKGRMREMGVELVDTIEAMLPKVDAVMLLSIDGRPHLKQAAPVLAAKKPLFIDKPVAVSLADIVRIFDLAKKTGTPCFSNSSLRYSPGIAGMRNDPAVGKVLGCDAYSSNAPLEPSHPDFFYYGIHGAELLFTIMGPGCKTVSRVKTPTTDLAAGVWEDGRLGTLRGIREGRTGFGATVFGDKGIAPAGKFEGYAPLLVEIAKFFRTGKPPFTPEQTLEIYAFMEGADESQRQGGVPVSLESVLDKARKAAEGQSSNYLKNPTLEVAEQAAPTLPEHWNRSDGPPADFSLDDKVVRQGKHSLRIGGDGFRLMVQEVSPIAKGKRLVLTGFAKTKGNCYANLWINCLEKEERTYVDAAGLQGDSDWTELKTHMVVPAGCTKLEAWLYYAGSEPASAAWFDDLRLREPLPGEELPRTFVATSMKGPGIASAEGCYEFQASEDVPSPKIAFPIPQMYAEQVPFFLEYDAQPADAITGAVLQPRKDAPPNWYAELQFKPMKQGDKIQFHWKAHVLVLAKDYAKLPKQANIPAIGELPEDVRPWLKATRSVQADDEGIRRKAKEIRDAKGDLIQTIRNAIAFSTETSRNPKSDPNRPGDCSAVTALRWGEICTGSANLAAALLRANGIPARLLANYPAWNQLFATHYYIEVYIPDYGWTRAESIMDRFPVETYRDVVVSVVYPQDEERSFDSPRWAAAGCPRLSLTEPVGEMELTYDCPWQGGDHVAAPVVEFRGTDEAFRNSFELTREVWTRFQETAIGGGTPPQRAVEFQKKACAAKDLAEFTEAMRRARDAYVSPPPRL